MDTDRVCRICLGEAPNMESIFTFSPASKMMLATSISIVTALEFFPDDGLPQFICISCAQDARMAISFKQKCIESDKELRERLIKCGGPQPTIDTKENIMQCSPDRPDDLSDEEIRYGLLREYGIFSKDTNTSEHEIEPVIPSTETSVNVQMEDQTTLVHKLKKKTSTKIKLAVKPFKKTVRNQVQTRATMKKKKQEILKNTSIFHSTKTPQAVVNKVFKCQVCSEAYASEASILLHMKTHSAKVFACIKCKEHFPNNDLLIEHNKKHPGERTFGCALCEKKFYSQALLDRHSKTHKPIGPQLPVECPICRKQFQHDYRLKTHMQCHSHLQLKDPTEAIIINESTNEKTEAPATIWLCTICGIDCKTKHDLAVHERRHRGEMTHFCKECGKGYPRKTDLTVHMRKHTGEKPYQCPICKKAFRRSDTLTIHLRIHSGEKPYVCEFCKRAFIQKNDLASHKRKGLCKMNFLNMDQTKLNKQEL